MSIGLINEAPLARFVSAMRARRTFITGFLNSNGEKDGYGIIDAIQWSLAQSGIKLYGCTPITPMCKDETTGVQSTTETVAGTVRGLNGHYRVPISTATGGYANPSNVSEAPATITSIPTVTAGNAHTITVNNTYAIGDWVMLTATNSTPAINSVVRVTAATATTFTYTASVTVTVAGTAGNAQRHYRSVVPNLAVFYEHGEGRNPENYSGAYSPLLTVNGYSYNTAQGGNGVEIQATPPNPMCFNPANAITVDYWYGNATPSGGTFTPKATQGSVPNIDVPFTDTSAITVASGTPSKMLRATKTLNALGTVNTKLRIGYGTGSVTPTGQVFLGYLLAWETNATTGAVVSRFWARGGQSVHDFAFALRRTDGDQITPQTLIHFFQMMARPAQAANQKPTCLFVINDGSNYTTELSNSVNADETASSTNAYIDDASLVIGFVIDAWLQCGFDAENIVFVVHPDHPNTVGTAEPKQVDYRSIAIPTLASRFPRNVTGINANSLWTTAALINAGAGNVPLYASSRVANAISAVAVSGGGTSTITTIGALAGIANGSFVTINATNSTPPVDGTWQVSNVASNTFTIPVSTVTVAGTSGWASIANVSSVAVSAGGTSTITTTSALGLTNGDHVIINGTNSTPNVNGTWQVSNVSGSTFRIAVANVTVAGTTGQTWTLDPYHLAVPTTTGGSGNVNGYRTYWAAIWTQLLAANRFIGVGRDLDRQVIRGRGNTR